MSIRYVFARDTPVVAVQWEGDNHNHAAGYEFAYVVLKDWLANGRLTSPTAVVEVDGSLSVSALLNGTVSVDIITVPVGGWVLPASLTLDGNDVWFDEWYRSTDTFEQRYRFAN